MFVEIDYVCLFFVSFLIFFLLMVMFFLLFVFVMDVLCFFYEDWVIVFECFVDVCGFVDYDGLVGDCVVFDCYVEVFVEYGFKLILEFFFIE